MNLPSYTSSLTRSVNYYTKWMQNELTGDVASSQLALLRASMLLLLESLSIPGLWNLTEGGASVLPSSTDSSMEAGWWLRPRPLPLMRFLGLRRLLSDFFRNCRCRSGEHELTSVEASSTELLHIWGGAIQHFLFFLILNGVLVCNTQIGEFRLWD